MTKRSFNDKLRWQKFDVRSSDFRENTGRYFAMLITVSTDEVISMADDAYMCVCVYTYE